MLEKILCAHLFRYYKRDGLQVYVEETLILMMYSKIQVIVIKLLIYIREFVVKFAEMVQKIETKVEK